MSIITDLLQKHYANLDRSTAATLVDLAAKMSEVRDYAWPDDNPANHAGLAKIERVFSPTPVDLFGQEVGALSYNKLTISRSGSEEELISLHLSDQALTNLMLLSNSGMHSIPGTTVSLGSETLPAYKMGASEADRAFTERRDQVQNKFGHIFEGLAASLETATNAKNRKQAHLHLHRAREILNNNGELSFYLEQRMSDYGAKRVDLISEISQASYNADHILRSETPLLPVPIDLDPAKSRRHNPMMNALLAHWTKEEQEAVAILTGLEIERIHLEHDIDISDILADSGQLASSQSFRGMSKECRSDLENIRGIVNASMNTNVLKGNARRRPHQLGLSLTRRPGNREIAHSSLPGRSDDIFALSIGAAYHEDDFGSTSIRGSSQAIIEIEMTGDDLMMLFRGNISGAPVPCLLNNIAGVPKHLPAPYQKQVNIPIKAVSEDVDQDERKKTCFRSFEASGCINFNLSNEG